MQVLERRAGGGRQATGGRADRRRQFSNNARIASGCGWSKEKGTDPEGPKALAEPPIQRR
jgi:hypothetical protein